MKYFDIMFEPRLKSIAFITFQQNQLLKLDSRNFKIKEMTFLTYSMIVDIVELTSNLMEYTTQRITPRKNNQARKLRELDFLGSGNS